MFIGKNMKYYKIVYGFNQDDCLSITEDELHKAFVIAMEGGKATFKAGFFQNRGNDVLRIVEDWHTAKGWNKTWKMGNEDYEDIRRLETSYKKTLESGRLLAESIIKNDRRDLISKPMSEALLELNLLQDKKPNFISTAASSLVDKFRIK